MNLQLDNLRKNRNGFDMTLQIISLNLSIKNVWLYVSNVISNVEHCGHTVVVNKNFMDRIRSRY